MATTETMSNGFTAAVEHLHRPLARFAYLICGDADRAEDLVADAYARVWPRWRAGRVDDLGAYLRRTIVNRSHHHWRRGWWVPRDAQPCARSSTTTASRSPASGASCGRTGDRRRVRARGCRVIRP